MSDYDFPDLPSDEELGITDEDREFLKEMGDDRPEMSDAELKALLGDAPAKPVPDAPPKRDKKAQRAAKKAERAAAKETKRKAKEAKKADRAPKAEPGPETDSERAQRIARSLGSAPAAAPKGAGAGPPPAPKARTAPARADAERSRWRGPVTLLALVLLSVVASSRTGLPRPVPANATETEFSSSRAMSSLIEIGQRKHPPGSPEHARVRDYLVARLRELGMEPQIQVSTPMIQAGPRVRAGTMRNVVARLPGTDPTGAILMTAHYDGRELSPAAADDGVGVVAILEAVRALRAGGPIRNDLIVLFTDGEEVGLLGSRAFVDEHPWMADVSLVLSFEMRGSAGPSIMFETKDQNGWIVRELDDFDPHPFANSAMFEVYRRMPNDTDYTPFREAGAQGLNFAAIDNAHVYHQAYDTPQNVSESTLQHHGVQALAAARHLGDADLTSVDAPDVVYFTVPVLGMIVYDQAWVLAVSGALLLLLIGAFFVAYRGGASPGKMALGFLVSVVTIAVSVGAAYAVTRWLRGFHPEAGTLHGSLYHREGWYVVSLVAITFTAFTTLYTLARMRLSVLELGVGAVILPAVAAVTLGFAFPMAAMNLQYPVIAGLLSLLVVGVLRARSDGVVGWVTAILVTTPVLFLLVPLSELVWLALRFELARFFPVLFSIVLFLCVPAIESLGHPNRWWAPVTGLILGLGALGMGLLNSRSNAERPAPSTLVYAYEHGTGAAMWVTDPTQDSLDADATAWAVEKAGGSFDGLRDLSGFAYGNGQKPTAPAPVVSAAPPEVIITRDTVDAGTRYVTLRVRSRIGAEYLAFEYDDVGSTRLVSLNGSPLAHPEELAFAEHWGEPNPSVVLELEMPEGQAIGLQVVEHLLRPEELLGADAFDRPPHLAPNVMRLSDRAMFRYSVGAFADPRHAILMPGAQQPTAAPSEPAAGAPAVGVTPADTLPSDTLPSDTLPADTVARDTVTAEQPSGDTASTTPGDTASVDTLAGDTAVAGTLPDDTASVDTLAAPPDTTRTPRGGGR